jgi:hypothetical protein
MANPAKSERFCAGPVSESPILNARCYRFRCPACEMTDEELGFLATADETECLVCLNEDGKHVRLHRWHVEEDQPVRRSFGSPARVPARALSRGA